ncbi:glycyl-radical enzyme activating protein [Christensenella timonensis]|uniref:glycyl-radical enzyme activating protein n=1 Tax=Christensenella timonensis TaxID=1816678 RepID=UPI00082C4E75|nr:glycyl-radical enzyme activating protein [Christensenella timonensis]
MEGCVFDIQRFCVHDGPGIRTTVFLKGCPLRCKWCCNPESMHAKPEVLFNPELCIGCGACAAACTAGAVRGGDGMDRSICTGCGKCAEECYADARYVKGGYMTPAQVLDEVLKDTTFYERTGGGVTFSGGEPLLQVDFLEETLALCRENGLGTAIETCGNVPYASFERIANLVDLFLFDIKSTDSKKHLEYTGVENRQILDNCEQLAKIAKRVVVRVPVIPEFNFDTGELGNIVRFAEKIGVDEVNFLPYHRMAANKYSFLNRAYWDPGIERLDESEVENCIKGILTSVRMEIGG